MSCISDISFHVRKHSFSLSLGLRRSPGAEGDSKAIQRPGPGSQLWGRTKSPELELLPGPGPSGVWQQEDNLILFHSMKHVFLSKTNFPSPSGTPVLPTACPPLPSLTLQGILPWSFPTLKFVCVFYRIPELHTVNLHFLSLEGYADCL